MTDCVSFHSSLYQIAPHRPRTPKALQSSCVTATSTAHATSSDTRIAYPSPEYMPRQAQKESGSRTVNGTSPRSDPPGTLTKDSIFSTERVCPAAVARFTSARTRRLRCIGADGVWSGVCSQV